MTNPIKTRQMKTRTIPVFAISSVLLCGCMAFNVGEPQRWTIDRGSEGKVVVTRQKKMSIGFFPSEAEHIWKPAGAVKPLAGWNHSGNGNYFRDNREPGYRYLFFCWFTTPWSILVTPWYGNYACDSHHWRGNNVELIRLLPAEAQEEIHVKTYADGDRKWGVRSSFSHSSLLGCHRYATVVVEETSAGDEDDGNDADED